MKKALPWLALIALLSVTVIAFSRPREDALLVLCAASLRLPVEKIAHQYRQQTGVKIHLQYGGSQQLLAGIATTRKGDLFIPAADTYLKQNSDTFPLATMHLVLAVKAGNPKQITTLADLLKPSNRISLPDPDSAAAGQLARTVLGENWPPILRAAIVTKPTVTDCANDVKLGSADACITFDAVAAQYPELAIIPLPQLAQARATVAAAVLATSAQPEKARAFAKFLTAPEQSTAFSGYTPIVKQRSDE